MPAKKKRPTDDGDVDVNAKNKYFFEWYNELRTTIRDHKIMQNVHQQMPLTIDEGSPQESMGPWTDVASHEVI
jgi:hypothetical protein